MPFRFDDKISPADVAFEAWGETQEELFIASAAALLRTMVEAPEAVARQQQLTIRLEDEALDMLLWSFLSELIFYKDARRLLLHADAVRIEAGEGIFRLQAQVSGEEIATDRHHCLVDVKAVTLHCFRVVYEEDCWRAVVVLDV
jgi:SHS2 domain-containing protein